MTVAAAWPLQENVFSAVTAALVGEGISVMDHAPEPPPNEYVRLDGFSMRDRSLKNQEIGVHSFIVHYFALAKHGQKTVKLQLAKIHTAIMAADLQGSSAKMEFMEVPTDTEGTHAHGFTRYSVTV